MQQTNPHGLSNGYLNYLLAIFFLINVSSYMDRMVLSVMVEPIRLELGLSDAQIGLLTGFAFALMYAIAGFPIARLADKGNRKRIITVCMLVWSGMTALSGRAQNFMHLFLARVGVGVGEAGCFPTANALIAELFPLERRSMAMGIFMAGSTVGAILGFVLGGILVEAIGWRMTFLLLGIPGVVLAVLVTFSLREPPVKVIEKEDQTPYFELLKLIFSSPTYRWLVFGASLGTFATYGMVQWAPAFFIRVHDMSVSQVGLVFGLCFGGGSAFGTLFGGWLTDKLLPRSTSWVARVPSLAYLLACPMLILMFLTDNLTLSFVFVFIGAFVASCANGPTLTAIQLATPEEGRATAAAILLLFISLLGIGAGPLIVGLISDALQGQYGVQSLRYALMFSSLVVLVASFCFFVTRGSFEHITDTVVDPSITGH